MQYNALNFFNSLIDDEGYVHYYTRDYTYFSQKSKPQHFLNYHMTFQSNGLRFWRCFVKKADKPYREFGCP